MAKAFISFLGTSNYVDCRYELAGHPGHLVKYIQEDMASRFCRPWSNLDEIRIFTTKEARKKNWQDNGHGDKPNAGLEKRLLDLGLSCPVRRVDIPEGHTENEIWKIFDIVFKTMTSGEEIVFDITHSFRSIPMLFMVLINYAAVIKDIRVTGIYYGAFEVLGHPGQVPGLYPDPETRRAPIFDLTSFIALSDWSRATHSFVRHGIADDFLGLINEKINPLLAKSKGRDTSARNMTYVVENIRKITHHIQFNRGHSIICHDYEQTMANLGRVKKDPGFIPPFGPLMEKIEHKIQGFEKYDVNNGFRAVDWAMEHHLIQQAVTMLWENIITWVLAQEKMAWENVKNRDAASTAIHFLSLGKMENKDPNPELTAKLKQNPVLAKISKTLEKLRHIRNDLNHGGYIMEENKRAASAESIRDQFEEIYKTIRPYFF